MSSATPAPSDKYQLSTFAVDGFSDAATYDLHRPSYPAEAVSALLGHLRLADRPHARVVEVAAGTGKFTELLAARPERFRVAAVEPHAGMRAQLESKALRGVDVLDGLAARMPLADEEGDACIAAQSFHWFATDEALQEIHRVLKPNAVFGMIWNIEEYQNPRSWTFTTSWEKKLSDLMFAITTDGQPRFRDEAWRAVFEKHVTTDGLPKFSLLLGHDSVKWTIYLTEEALWSRFNTLSQVAVLEGEQREAAVQTFREALRMDDVQRNEKGELALHGTTYFAWTSKL